jgi:threonyl-tRNA synthetase
MISWKRIFVRKNRCYSGLADTRLSLWEQEYGLQTQIQDLAKPISITLPDDTILIGEKGITTPQSIAFKISPGLAKDAIIAQSATGDLLEMSVPLLNDISRLTFLKFDSDAGKQTLWHSSAHILGQAIETYYQQKGGASLADGPPLLNHHAGGFFYDFMLHAESLSVGPEDIQKILEICQKIIQEKQEFQKLRVTKEKAIQFFSHNPLKLELIQRIPPNDPITLYKCGPFIDLCRGPHISNTSEAAHFDLTSFAPSIWQKNDGKSLTVQRIYGISFKDKKLLKNWKEFREEAAKRDHRLIGKQQQLFMFSPLSPGSAFILPMGTRIYNTLISFIKSKYIKYGFQEVITPILYHSDLWKRSGHWDHYKEDMFFVNCDKESVSIGDHTHGSGCNHGEDTKSDDNSLGLKPMNCPAHCLIFSSASRSWRDLPVKFADFSPLHRHESSGSLKGLTRLRRFVQDDAHIFCRLDQIKTVITECLEFLNEVYKALGFKYRVVLSTRPEVFMGSIDKWNEAKKSYLLVYKN